MTEVVYNVAKARMANGSLDWDTTDLRMLALSVAPAGVRDPDIDTVTALLAVSTTAEVASTGYSRKTMGTKTVTEDDTNNRANLDFATVAWTGLVGQTFTAVVVYEEGGGTDSTRNLVSYHDTGFPVTVGNPGGALDVTTPNDVLRLS